MGVDEAREQSGVAEVDDPGVLRYGELLAGGRRSSVPWTITTPWSISLPETPSNR